MSTAADLARGWMLKGDSDRLDAQRGLASAGPYDTTCFHTQQAAEKHLKRSWPGTDNPIPEHTSSSCCTTSVFRWRPACPWTVRNRDCAEFQEQ